MYSPAGPGLQYFLQKKVVQLTAAECLYGTSDIGKHAVLYILFRIVTTFDIVNFKSYLKTIETAAATIDVILYL